jgi:DNA-binding NarL/FixJ family response regulator
VSSIYLIEMEGTPGLVKIGFAKYPAQRMYVLQLTAPARLRVVATVECMNEQHARFIEKRAHLRFASSRRSGEWFQLDSIASATAQIQQLVQDTAAQFIDPPVRKAPDIAGRRLSLCEWQIVELYAEGFGCNDVAIKLGKSVKTISTQADRAARKLGLDSVRKLPAYAHRCVEQLRHTSGPVTPATPQQASA